MKLEVLGSGSPEPHMPQACTGYLIEMDSDCMLFARGAANVGIPLRFASN